MKATRYIDIHKLIDENLLLKTVMEQLTKEEGDYSVKGIDGKETIIKIFNERNEISFVANTHIDVVNDIIRFLSSYMKETIDQRKKILSALEVMSIIYQYEAVLEKPINILEETLEEDSKNVPLSNSDDEEYYYSYNDEEIFNHLMEDAVFFEHYQDILEFIYEDEGLLSKEGKDLLIYAMAIDKSELGRYQSVGHYLLDQHEKVIITKYGFFYSDIMI